MSELERCIEFITRMAESTAREQRPSAYGVALLDPELPDVWSRNYLLVRRGLEQVTVPELAAESERLLGEEGLRHRKVEVFDDALGTQLEAGFRDLGWFPECDVIMVWTREPDRPVDTSLVEEVDADELVPAWTESWSTDPNVFAEDVARQLVENKRRLGRVTDTRFFAARVDGEVASYCELYSDGRTAQIENVLTLDRFRKRGLARAIVTNALSEARSSGHDLIFLIANRDDWPKELYRKLGFETVGQIWEFVLPRAV